MIYLFNDLLIKANRMIRVSLLILLALTMR